MPSLADEIKELQARLESISESPSAVSVTAEPILATVLPVTAESAVTPVTAVDQYRALVAKLEAINPSN
jgi:hypothetical protein